MTKIGSRLEEELIYGAMDRENRWRRIAYIGAFFGIAGCLMAGAVAVAVDKPAPVLVPYDVRNGAVLPEVNVSAISTKQQDAIIESMIYSYVTDRETYNIFDNDIRINAVRNRSTGVGLRELMRYWDSSNADYLPAQYGDKARIDVAISNINLMSDNRAQVRLQKRLTTSDGITDGVFLVTLEYDLVPARQSSLEAVWKNPFGFMVTNYRIVSNQYERN